MDEETTRNLPQDGVERILASLDSLDARLTTLEDKIAQWLQEDPPNLRIIAHEDE